MATEWTDIKKNTEYELIVAPLNLIQIELNRLNSLQNVTNFGADNWIG